MKPGRNDPCTCGSGRKFKKCCLPTLSNVAVPARTKPQPITTHKVQRNGKWEERPGTIAITLGGKRAEDVDDELEGIFAPLVRKGGGVQIDRIHDVKHKLYAARFHAEAIGMRIDEELDRYASNHNPGSGVAWELEDPAIVYQTEAFLFQVKSALDVLTQLLAVHVPRLKNFRTFAHSGEVRDGSYLAGGKVLKELRTANETSLWNLIDSNRQEWIQELVLMRDDVAHYTKVKGLRCFVEGPYVGGETATIELPKMPNGRKVDAYCEEVLERLARLMRDCVSILAARS